MVLNGQKQEDQTGENAGSNWLVWTSQFLGLFLA